MTSANNKVSNHISSQVPFFVRNDHPQFVAFLESYFQYLEQENKAVETAASLKNQIDIDQTKSINEEHFYDTFLKLVPKESIVDKKLLLKNVKDFYRSRGTEKSIRFLMRVLFGEEVSDFYYPKTDILKVSDGKWFVEKSLKIASVSINGVVTTDQTKLQNFVGKQIKGSISGATAIVERISTYYDGGVLVNELKISNEYKSFASAESVSTLFTDTDGVQKTISAQLFQAGIEAVTLTSAGSGYKVGDTVTVESDTGTGGVIIVSSVSTGSLNFITTLNGGAGFQSNTSLLVTGGGGSGASAQVLTVAADNKYHPNTYSIPSSIIALEANTPIGNAVYSNLNASNANVTLANATSYFTYGNTGPISATLVLSTGNNYTSLPTVSAQANTIIRSLGILGRMEIVNGGLGYAVGDTIEFINVIGGYGQGGLANVSNVAANGAIQAVQFIQMPGHIIGGTGYDQFYLPRANVISGTGNGANVIVTAVLGRGESFTSTMTAAGSILSLSTISRGTGYQSAPTLNLKSIGDGTATAYATVISGAYSYPGRYLNDDGHVSGYNFIEDRDYYQTYSYVIKMKRSINDYRKAVKDLIHPAGMKLFGEYMTEDEGANTTILQNVEQAAANRIPNPTLEITFDSTTLDPNITYSRTSSASLVDANGKIQYYSANTPRIGYRTNRQSKGIYIERAATNLFLRSQEFANTYWSKRANSALTANAVMAPDGTMTGALYYDTGTSSGTYVSAAPTTVNNTVYTASAFVKRADMPMVRLTVYARSSTTNAAYTDFNFDTNTVSTVVIGTVTQVSGGATPAANGWWRIWVTSNTGSGTNLIPFRLGSSATYGLPSGNGKSSVYIWGAQLETSPMPTTYIPTTNTAMTRAADLVTVQGTAFSNVFNYSEGALYVEGAPSANLPLSATYGNYPGLLTVSDNAGNYRSGMYLNVPGTYQLTGFIRNSTQNDPLQGFTVSPNRPARAMLSYSTSLPELFSANGNVIGFGNANSVNSSVTRMTIGAADSYFDGFIRNVRYYNKYVTPNSTLQLLTART